MTFYRRYLNCRLIRLCIALNKRFSGQVIEQVGQMFSAKILDALQKTVCINRTR